MLGLSTNKQTTGANNVSKMIRQVTVFSRWCVLRIGMLLSDGKIALHGVTLSAHANKRRTNEIKTKGRKLLDDHIYENSSLELK